MEDKSKEQLQDRIAFLTKKLEVAEQEKVKSSKKKIWTGKQLFSFFIGKGLKDSLNKLYQELPDKVTKESLADVTANVIWRFTRIGLFAILAALIPYILLYKQNQKIDKQNELFGYQNKKIGIQTELLEADRRSALIFLMSNIMDKLDNELKEDWNNDNIRNISPELIGRISSLSYSFKPYRFLQGDTLISKPLSPERGQLLITLSKSNLDSISLLTLMKNCVFESADLRGVFLGDANLRGVSLNGADLEGAILERADLEGANFTGTNFSSANLEGTNLINSLLILTNFAKARLKNANLTNVQILSADFRGAVLDSVKFKNATISTPDFREADFNGTDFRGANFSNVNLEGINLENANLEGVDLKGNKNKASYFKGAPLRNRKIK